MTGAPHRAERSRDLSRQQAAPADRGGTADETDEAGAAGAGRVGGMAALLGRASMAVMVLDAAGSVVGWTEEAGQLFGYRAREVPAGGVERLVASWRDARPHGPDGWAARVRAGEAWSAVVDARCRDGRLVPVELEALPLAGADGRGDRWFVTALEAGGADGRGAAPAGQALRALLTHAPFALGVWDTDLRCVWVNATAGGDRGPFRHGHAGLPLREALRGFDTDTVETVMRRVLATGRPAVDHEFRWSSGDGAEELVTSSSVFRLENVDGTPIGVCTFALDVTRSRSRERLSVLTDAGRRIGTTLDVLTTAQELADVSVPLLADTALVELSGTVPLGRPPLELSGTSAEGWVPAFRRGGVAAVPGTLPATHIRCGEVVDVPPSSPMLRVLATGEPFLAARLDPSPGTWLADDPRLHRLYRRGAHSLMALPLRARDTTLGIAVFVRSRNASPFGPEDLALARELVTVASLSLDSVRRYVRERTASLALQRYLLPGHLSRGRSVEVAARYLPTARHEGVGGDWYDVLHLPGGRVALVIGDLVGHGLNAAATMGQLRTAVQTLAYLDLHPDELLVHLDRLAARLSEERSGPEGFADPPVAGTCLYAVYDPAAGVCTLSSAGHPPPALVHPDGSAGTPEVPPGPPLGTGLPTFRAVEVAVADGDVMALFTGSLIRIRTGDVDLARGSVERALARRPALPLEELTSDVLSAGLAGSSPEDDIALLLARFRPPGAGSGAP